MTLVEQDFVRKNVLLEISSVIPSGATNERMKEYQQSRLKTQEMKKKD